MSIVLALNVSLFHFRMVALNLGFALLSPEEFLKSPAPHATPKTSQGRISGAGAQVSVFFFFLNMERFTNLRVILAQGPC